MNQWSPNLIPICLCCKNVTDKRCFPALRYPTRIHVCCFSLTQMSENDSHDRFQRVCMWNYPCILDWRRLCVLCGPTWDVAVFNYVKTPTIYSNSSWKHCLISHTWLQFMYVAKVLGILEQLIIDITHNRDICSCFRICRLFKLSFCSIRHAKDVAVAIACR